MSGNATRSALLLGATGLVGRDLLGFLLRELSISSVVALVRRATLPVHPKLREVIVDFDRLESHADAFAGVDLVFCALGTTMRQAGSRDAFRKVDYTYPVTAARIALERGASHFLMVSALGANASSGIFYNRVKGETERDIAALGFRCLTIARPSLLVGRRRESRLGERIGRILGFLAPPSLRPISSRDVAAALTLASREIRSGVHVLTSEQMRGATSP